MLRGKKKKKNITRTAFKELWWYHEGGVCACVHAWVGVCIYTISDGLGEAAEELVILRQPERGSFGQLKQVYMHSFKSLALTIQTTGILADLLPIDV